MTIETIGSFGMTGSEHEQAKCVWIEKNKRFDGVFELYTLTKASTGTSGRIERA